MSKRQAEAFKNWLFDRTRHEGVKPEDYINRQARKTIRKQQEKNERQN